MILYLVPGAGTAVELRQSTLPRATIIAAVSAFRRAADAAGASSWHLARQRLPGAYQAMLDQVEVTAAEQPLPRLQAVGSSDTVFPFPYELSWGPRESFSPARLRRHGPRSAAVRLLPGAGDELLRLGPLVRPLVELHWTRDWPGREPAPARSAGGYGTPPGSQVTAGIRTVREDGRASSPAIAQIAGDATASGPGGAQGRTLPAALPRLRP